MVRWSSIHETLTTSFKLLMSTNVLFFFVLICEALIFHSCFSDVLLKLLWVNTDETAMIWMQTLSIFYVFNVLVSEKLMFHCCFNDGFLMIFWWDIDEKWRFPCKHYGLVKDLIVLIFYYLRLHCCLILYSLMSLWTNFDETLMILMQTLRRNILLNVLMFKKLRFL